MRYFCLMEKKDGIMLVKYYCTAYAYIITLRQIWQVCLIGSKVK